MFRNRNMLLGITVYWLLKFAAAFSPEVFITISSLASTNKENDIKARRIQLNWYNANPTATDWIGLFNHDPTSNITFQPLIKHLIKTPQGVYTTDHSLPYLRFESKIQRHCIGFWVAYVRSNDLIASNCLRIEPNWMQENRDVIGHLTFTEIMIPGTHDAGSFRRYQGWKSENVIAAYTFTQDENFWGQLVYGIRHFDIRVAFYSSLNEFYLNHAEMRANPLVPELKSVKRFAETTNELIILDFHSFETGFQRISNSTERHVHLLSLLVSELGSLIIPESVGREATLNKIWGTKHRILICYNNDFHHQSEYLWPGVYQAWANTMDIEKLKIYFDNFMSVPKLPVKTIWSAQAELTANFVSALLSPFKGLRQMADKVNLNVTYWFKDLWWHSANIVATDYFHGNNIVQVCIQANKKRRNLKPNTID